MPMPEAVLAMRMNQIAGSKISAERKRRKGNTITAIRVKSNKKERLRSGSSVFLGLFLAPDTGTLISGRIFRMNTIAVTNDVDMTKCTRRRFSFRNMRARKVASADVMTFKNTLLMANGYRLCLDLLVLFIAKPHYEVIIVCAVFIVNLSTRGPSNETCTKIIHVFCEEFPRRNSINSSLRRIRSKLRVIVAFLLDCGGMRTGLAMISWIDAVPKNTSFRKTLSLISNA